MLIAELQGFADDTKDVLLGRMKRTELIKSRDGLKITVVSHHCINSLLYLLISYIQIKLPR